MSDFNKSTADARPIARDGDDALRYWDDAYDRAVANESGDGCDASQLAANAKTLTLQTLPFAEEGWRHCPLTIALCGVGKLSGLQHLNLVYPSCCNAALVATCRDVYQWYYIWPPKVDRYVDALRYYHAAQPTGGDAAQLAEYPDVGYTAQLEAQGRGFLHGHGKRHSRIGDLQC